MMKMMRTNRGYPSTVVPKPKLILSVAVIVAMLTSAACSSSKTSSSSAATASNAAMTSAANGSGVSAEIDARLAKYANAPTGITQTQTVTKALPKKTVGFLICSDPSCAAFAGYWKTITDALGWKLQTVNIQGADTNSAVEQLVQSHVDYIGMTGSSIAQYKSAMADAKAANIPVFECFGTDTPAGPDNNLYSNCFDAPTYQLQGQLLADYMIKDSGGKAKVAGLNLPAYAVLTTMSDSIGAELKASCSGCSYGAISPTPDDLSSGKVANQVVSYLQTHPDVNYVVSTYAPLAQGLPQALKAAGLDKVKIVGSQPVKTQIQGIADGTLGSWLNLPREYSLWVEADQMVQLAAGQWSASNERQQALAPMYFLTKDNASAALNFNDGWPGPDGFREAFEKLWGVSS